MANREPETEFRLRNTGESLSETSAIEIFRASAVQAQDLVRERRPLEWVVDGLLPRDALYTAHGDPKTSAKSLLTLYLCTCIVRGIPFLGRAVTPGSAIYCNFEDGRHLCARRLWQLGIAEGEKLHPDHRLFIVNDPDLIGPTIRVAQTIRPTLLVLDTFTHLCLAHGVTEENNPEQVTKLVSFYANLCHAYKCSCLVDHHNRKDDFVMRGSTALIASLDGWWSIEPGEDGLRKIETTSKVALPRSVAFRVEGDPEDINTQTEITEADLEIFVPVPKTPRKGANGASSRAGGSKRGPRISDEDLHNKVCVELMGANGETLSVRALAKAVGCKRSRIEGKLTELEDLGLCCKGPKDQGWVWRRDEP